MGRLSITAVVVLAASLSHAGAQDAGSMATDAWEIGPMIRGKNYSVGLPPTPAPQRRGWSFAFPYPSAEQGHVHYLTFRHGPLRGASCIVLRYRIDAAPGVRFIPRENPEQPATVSLYFQRAGDTWSAKRHPNYRWYAPEATMRPLQRGVFEISADLADGNWISVLGQPASAHPEAFRQALDETDRVGFVLGSSVARGHGVFATGPARFTLISFEVR